jgi:hypothetical protein
MDPVVLKTIEHLPLSVLERLPAQQPPAGEVSNFINPPNLFTAVLIAVVISGGLMLGAVILRIYSKITSGRSFGWDDCMSARTDVDDL